MTDVQRRTEIIKTTDGAELAATAFVPADEPYAAVLVASALATPRGFYAPLAQWLAERGFEVRTFDYRSIGDSPPDDPVRADVDLSDWAQRDLPAAVRTARERSRSERVVIVGHSFGGQVTGLLGDRFDLAGLVTCSAQSGYWRLQYPGHRWKTLVAMGALFPVLVRTLGYLPWRALFGGADVPGPAARQWARWCLDPHYLMGDGTLEGRQRFADFSAPIVAYSFEDDIWGYREAVDWMMDQYVAAPVERLHVVPGDHGLDQIGHFGFFREEARSLWRDLRRRIQHLL